MPIYRCPKKALEFGTNTDGQICTQRAVDKAGKEFATGLEYRRSSSLASLNYNFSFNDPPTWFLPSKVNSGHLDFSPEDGGIKVGRNQGNLFQAYTLMKVNNEADGDAKFKVDANFFPLMHRMIREKTDWDISPGLRKEVLLSEVGIKKSPSLQAVGQSSVLSKNKNTTADKKCKAIPEFSSSGSSLGSSRDVNFKRARYEKPDDLDGVDIGTVVATDAGNFTPEVMSKHSSAPSLHAKVMNQPYGEKSAAYVSDGVVPSSLQEVKTSIHTLFGSEVSNLRQGYIIGEVENIFVRLSSLNLVFDVLRPIINLLESGRTELEWFVKTVRHVFVCASQISDNVGIIDQGNQIHDLFRRHDECLSTNKALESELTNSIQELKKIEAEELPVKEAEEVARVLRQQYDSGRLAVRRRVSDLKASIERQKKLDVELRQSRIDANEGLLPDVVRVEALNKSAEEGILNSIASLLHFCSKPE
ncbi:unnamed protein product [Malus baccata var. baccata]